MSSVDPCQYQNDANAARTSNVRNLSGRREVCAMAVAFSSPCTVAKQFYRCTPMDVSRSRCIRLSQGRTVRRELSACQRLKETGVDSLTPLEKDEPRRRPEAALASHEPTRYGFLASTARRSRSVVAKRNAFRVIGRACRLLLPVALVAFAQSGPLLAASLSVPMVAGQYEQAGFISGLASSFALVLVSEIGDKTFFISALLAMKYSRSLVLLGTMLALGSMTVISVGIGQVFHALPSSFDLPIPLDDYCAAALLVWFGIQGIRDGLSMKDADDEELRDAEEVVEGIVKKEGPRTPAVRVISETCSLVFLAEWGDKSMLATVALAAAKSPIGVIVGGVSGHLVATIIAVVGGALLGKYVSERTARLVGGFLFLVFAALTIFNLF